MTRSALTVLKMVTGRRTMEPTRQGTAKKMPRLNVEPTEGEMEPKTLSEYAEK